MALGEEFDTAPPRVLLVDDDAAVLNITRRTLQRGGCEVTACRDGLVAMQVLEQQSFDAMLTDVQMPGLSGVQLLRSVRERDLDLPVVLFTGSPDVATAASAVEYGAFQYLLKPVSREELHHVIRRATNASRIARLQRQYSEENGSGVMRVADRAGLEACFARALVTLELRFQPIVRAVDGSIWGYDVDVATSEKAFASRLALVDGAERGGRLVELGRAVRQLLAQAALEAPTRPTFLLRLHPTDLLDSELFADHAPLGEVAGQVVLSVTERASLDELPELRGRIAHLRQLGYRIALDELGAGYAGLTSFVRLEPELVKLDASLTRDIDSSEQKQKIVGSLVTLCHEMQKLIIADGISSAAEQAALVTLGCDLLQGDYVRKAGAWLGPSRRADTGVRSRERASA